MTVRYVWGAAAGTGTGADWANAHTTMQAAITASTAGDEFRTASDHNETIGVASTTLTFKGTAQAPDRVISVNRTSGLVEQGALLKTTGASNISVAGTVFFDGVNFTPGDAANSATMNFSTGVGNFQRVRNSLITTTNAVASRVAAAATPGTVTIFEKNVQISAGSVNCSIRPGAGTLFIWKDSGKPWINVIPTVMYDGTGEAVFDGLDISDHGSGKSVLGALASTSGKVTLRNCKLNSAMGMFSAAPLSRLQVIDVLNCSNADGKSRTEPHRYEGSVIAERAIVRTGGANDGTDNVSWKMVATAWASRDFPLESRGIAVNIKAADLGAPKTATVEIVGDVSTLNDDQAWLEVQYLGTALSLDSSTVSDGPATSLTAGAAQASSSVAWTTTGIPTPIKQKLEVTFTPLTAGQYIAVVRFGKPSATLYIDPKVVLS